MNWTKNLYNKKSAKRFSWHPNWFGEHLTDFNNDLLREVVIFQHDHDLEADG